MHDGSDAHVATRRDECPGVRHRPACPLPLLPPDAAKDEKVVGGQVFEVLEWPKALCDTIVQSSLHYFGPELWYDEIKGGVSTVVHSLAFALKAGVHSLPLMVDRLFDPLVLPGFSPEIYTLLGLVEHYSGNIYCERACPHLLG